MEDARTIHYYGIEFSNGKPGGQEFYCIQGRRQPTISEVRAFTKGHFDTSGKPPVTVTEITEEEALQFDRGDPPLNTVFADAVFFPTCSRDLHNIVIEEHELVAETSEHIVIHRRLYPAAYEEHDLLADAWGREIFHTYAEAKAAVNSPEWKAAHGLNPEAVLKVAQ